MGRVYWKPVSVKSENDTALYSQLMLPGINSIYTI